MEDKEDLLFQEMQDEYLHYENIVAKVAQSNVIVKKIFSLLSLNDLKNCRYVCQIWNAIAEPLLRQRSKIVFNFMAGLDHTRFADTFRMSKSRLKFTSFKFSEGYWPLSTVNDFVQQQIRNTALEELEFSGVVFTDENGEIDLPLINDLIDDFEELKIRKLVISNNVFTINSDWVPMVSLDALTSLKEIVLENCCVYVNQGTRIAPTKLTFKEVTFQKDGTKMREFCVNDIVNFKDTEYIAMQFTRVENGHDHVTKIVVDLKNCMKLRKLNLEGVEVTNWSGEKCNLEEVFLNRVPFLKTNAMKVKKMSFEDSSVLLTVLPLAIEDISFYSDDTKIQCPHPINFPNLKCLSMYDKAVNALSHFKNCASLKELCIDGPRLHVNPLMNRSIYPPELNMELIPKSVRQIQLQVYTQIGGHQIVKLELDVLFLGSHTFANAEEVLQKIKPRRLVLKWQINVEEESNDSVLLFLDKYKDLKEVFVGPFYFIHSHQFTRSRLSQFVDQQAKFYFFENQRGTAIKEADFNNLIRPNL